MTFSQKINGFLKNFFKNIISDPISTLSGVGKIAAGIAGMVTMYKTPIAGDLTAIITAWTAAGGLIVSGLVSLGTDRQPAQVDKEISDAEKKVEAAIPTLEPIYQDVVAAIHAAGEQASIAAKAQAAAAAIAKIQEQAGTAPAPVVIRPQGVKA